MAASGTPHPHKRGSLHRLSHTILSLASPPFSRVSFDTQGFGSRKKSPVKTVHGTSSLPATSPLSLTPTNEIQSGYTPSIVSAAESQLSSPYSPLLPTSPRWPAVDAVVPVPPTTNELSEEEKMKLMKKVRKLSKVLGEVPVPAAVKEELLLLPPMDDESDAPGSPMMTSAAAKKAFRRSLTFGQSADMAHLDTPDVHRAKSFSTLRPSLHIPPRCPSDDALPLPSSPIMFARAESVDSHRDISDSGLSTSAPEARSIVDSYGLRRRDSTASSVLLADQNVEQVHRTRAAKLSRHFGTNIPPEVLYRAASPPPPSPPALYALPTKVLSSDQIPQRSSSLRRKPRRRPASLDIRPISGIIALPSSSPSSPTTQTRPTGGLKRSRSLWTKQPRTCEDAENAAAKDEAELDLNPLRPMSLSEKQRVLNVRRARKMAQVRASRFYQQTRLIDLRIVLASLCSITDLQLFGDNPPSALFQITNFAPGLVEDGGDAPGRQSSDGHRYERDSLATIISISTTSLSPMLSATGKARLRDSFVSVITTSSEISGLVLTEETDEPEAMRASQESEDVTTQAQGLTVPILSSLPQPRRKGVHPSTILEPGRSESSHQPYHMLPISQPTAAYPARIPPTPPPFSNIISPPAMRPATAPPSSPVPSEFQTRRRRVTKLSKFFGVEVNELAEALPTGRSPSISASRKTSMAQEGSRERSLSGGLTHRASVMVAEARRRRYNGMDDDDVEERDLSEVMDQLRKLRS